MVNGGAVTIRRLPVYLLLDCSGTMNGEPVAAMETGLKLLLSDLRNDPQALETIWLSAIAFGSTAEQLVPLTDLCEFEVPPLEASGTTSLGEAFDLLAKLMSEEVRKTTENQKGDWKPMVFLFTDGEPTDDWEEPVRSFRQTDLATIIACGAGPEVNTGTLKRIGDTVIRLADTQPGTLGSFMKWVSLSVTMTSRSLGTLARSGDMLAELPEDQGISLVP